MRFEVAFDSFYNNVEMIQREKKFIPPPFACTKHIGHPSRMLKKVNCPSRFEKIHPPFTCAKYIDTP